MKTTTEATDPFAGITVVAQTPAVPLGPPPTPGQVNYLTDLAGQAGEDLSEILPTLTFSTISHWIDKLKAQVIRQRVEAWDAAKAKDAETPEGFHEIDGQIYKVQRAVYGSGNLYAKRLRVEAAAGDPAKWLKTPKGDRWEYAGRAPLASLSVDTLLTLDRAKELGHLYGICCRCGATLTKEASIAAGIGPWCAGQM